MPKMEKVLSIQQNYHKRGQKNYKQHLLKFGHILSIGLFTTDSSFCAATISIALGASIGS